eukprot:TRINITY_DN5052_c0_g2_i1.p1 TRINITY_DN5052_c0_g2~~TRINITY_DN5052_c0_g2_i1.p1  ORF type:complete len:146 (-),score=42.53 TRINITY_DN5052_c0_g2_i1:205-642(-)
MANEVIDQFLQLQTQRVAVYTRFHQIFKEYIENKDFSAYDEKVRHITAEFAQISKQIISTEQQLRDQHANSAANLIRLIQENEKEKLQLTIAQQIMKKENLVDQEGEYDPLYEHQLKLKSQKLNEIILNINDALEEIRELRSEGE